MIIQNTVTKLEHVKDGEDISRLLSGPPSLKDLQAHINQMNLNDWVLQDCLVSPTGLAWILTWSREVPEEIRVKKAKK